MPLSSARKQRVNVIQQRRVRWRVAASATGATMAAQVDGDQGHALFDKSLGDLPVLPAMLAEPMEDAHDTPRGLVRSPLAREQAKPVRCLKLDLGLLQSTIPNSRSANGFTDFATLTGSPKSAIAAFRTFEYHQRA